MFANPTSVTTSHKNFSVMAHIMYFFSNDPSHTYLETDDFSFCSFPFLYGEGFFCFLNCWVCRLAWNSKFDILDGKSEDLHVWWNMLAFPFSLSLFLNISSLSTVSTCYKSVSQILPPPPLAKWAFRKTLPSTFSLRFGLILLISEISNQKANLKTESVKQQKKIWQIISEKNAIK